MRLLSSIPMLLAVVVGTSTMYAQSLSPLAQRDSIRARLNRAMVSLSDLNTDEIIDISGLGEIELGGLGSGCDTLHANPPGFPNTLKLHYLGNDLFSLQMSTATARTMRVLPVSHWLPCALNGMIYHNWGKVFRDSLQDFYFWDTVIVNTTYGCPHPPSVKTPISTQKYYMGHCGISNQIRDSLLVLLQDKSYVATEFENFSGTTTLGENIFRVTDRTALEFIAKYAEDPVTGTDTNLAKPVNWELTFFDKDGQPTWDQTLDSALYGIKLITRMQEYPDENCSFAPFMTPDDSAWFGVEVTIAHKTGDGPYTYTTTTYSPRCYHKFSGGTVDQNNKALWDAFDAPVNGAPINWWCKFDIDTMGWLNFQVWGSECSHRDTIRIMRIKNPDVPASICEETFNRENGTFCTDAMTGELYFASPNCLSTNRQPVSCLSFCRPISGYRTVDSVIAASSQTFSDEWPYSQAEFGEPPFNSNAYQTGEKGKWRPKGEYAYRSAILSGTPVGAGTARAYTSAGVFVDDAGAVANAFSLYNWRVESANDTTRWVRADSMTRSIPSGEPAEAVDVLGIYSAAKFSHNQMLAKLIAKNAQYQSVEFESFEDGNGNVTGIAHSGKSSFLLEKSATELISSLAITQQMLDQGLQIQFWAKKSYWNLGSHPSRPVKVTINGFTTVRTLDSIAKTGAWTLYRLNADDISGVLVGAPVSLSFEDELPAGDSVWIDDIRVQPLDAQMVCYVYDPTTFRLAATFDDQHFGLYYQYNGEGKLVRKLRETERGMKTVVEAQYHTPSIAREGMIAGLGDPAEHARAARGAGGNGSRRDISAGSEAQSNGDNIDLLDIELGAGKPKVKVLGSDDPTLPDINSMQPPDGIIPSISLRAIPDSGLVAPEQLQDLQIPGVSEAAKAEAIREIRNLDSTMRALAEKKGAAMTEEGRKTLDQEILTLRRRRGEIIREKLGVTEEELRQILEQNEEAQD